MSTTYSNPYADEATQEPTPHQEKGPSLWRRRWFQTAAVGTVALVVGISVGAGATPAATATPEYLDLSTKYEQSQSALEDAEDRVTTLERYVSNYEGQEQQIADRESAVEEQEAALEEREAGLDEREKAVKSAEDEKAANTITEGTWTVGVDVAPGTYRVDRQVTSGMCYWETSRAGSNGDIIDNDIVTGGRPSVTLAEGQEFTTHDCGSWVKQ